jgi:hypothetical protein
MVIAVMTKETLSSLLTTFSRWCVWLLQRIWYYISWFTKKADPKVTLFYPAFGRVQCGCDTLTRVSSLSNQYRWGSKSPPEASLRFIQNTYSLTIPRIWSTLARNMFNALSAKRNHFTRTALRLTMNNVTQYPWMKGYYLMGCYLLQAGIKPSHHRLTSVGAPKWPLMN